MPELLLIFFLKLDLKNSIILLLSSLELSHSIPAYTSSVFSLKTIRSTFSGFLTGDGTPLIHFIGLTHAYKSKTCLRVTFKLLIPPPTGVVNGPLIATLYS